jgi:hypothetical protein
MWNTPFVNDDFRGLFETLNSVGLIVGQRVMAGKDNE